MANVRVDSLVTSGPVPPGPAFDIAIGIAERLVTSGPVGPIMLRPDRVQLGMDGSVTLIGNRMPGATPDGDAVALGALLCHMVIGAPYAREQHAACVREITASLELWPGGSDAIAAIVELVERDPKATSGINPIKVAARLRDVRTRLGGSALSAWLANLHGTPAPSDRFGVDPMNPEMATGAIPVGALAKLVSQGPPSSSTPTGIDLRAVDVAPKPAPQPSGSLHGLAKSQPATTPIPEGRAKGPSTSTGLLVSGMVLWGMTVLLLLVALALVAFLLR